MFGIAEQTLSDLFMLSAHCTQNSAVKTTNPIIEIHWNVMLSSFRETDRRKSDYVGECERVYVRLRE